MKDRLKAIFVNPHTVMSFIAIFLFLVVSTSVLSIWNPFAPSGYILGNFVSAEHRGFGDFCGQYPFTRIVLNNCSVVGDIDDWDNEFYFGNQYSNVDNLKVNQRIKISYHQDSRPSDTTSGDTIYYWVIDNIEEI